MGWMDSVRDVPGALGDLFQRNDDDMFDRLSHRVTVIQLAVFAVFLSAEQYVGKPISCWSPAHFHSSWEKYTNSHCWVQNTYYLPWNTRIPKTYDEREETELKYYQWVPLILVSQAIFFFLPIVFWRSINQKTGIDVNFIVEASERYQNDDEIESRGKILDLLVNLTDRFLGYRKTPTRNTLLANLKGCSILTACCGKRFGSYMSIMYLVTKLLFIGNALGQLYFLNAFLGNDFNMYGIHVLQSWMGITEWTESRRFPRVTMCDMPIRRLGNIHRYTVQCVLTINLFHEMVYLFVWFWLVFLAALSIYGLISWLLRLFVPGAMYTYIRNNLASHRDFSHTTTERNEKKLRQFVDNYLKQDGVLVFHLVDLNTNKLTLMDILGALWDHYRDEHKDDDVHKPLKPTTEFDNSMDTLPKPRNRSGANNFS